MINWFLSLFGLRKEITKTRSTQWCEPITPWEHAFLNSYHWICPDCEVGTLMWGPEGGAMVNVACNHCKAAFNLTQSAPGGIDGQRLALGPKHPPSFYRG